MSRDNADHAWRRLTKWAVRFLAGIGFLLCLVSIAPPRWYARVLAGPWRDPRAPVLVVLTADGFDSSLLGEGSYWRSVYAILAWREGGFKRMILSGGPDSTAAMRDFLVCQGVPAAAVAIEGESFSTRESAIHMAQFARSFPGPYVLLTSDYHMWRASRAFQKAGVQIQPRPFPDAGKRFNQWTARWQVFLELAIETVKIGYYRLRGWI